MYYFKSKLFSTNIFLTWIHKNILKKGTGLMLGGKIYNPLAELLGIFFSQCFAIY